MKKENRTKGFLFVMIICLLVGCFSFESEAAAKIYWKNTANTRTVLVNSSTTLKTNYKNSKVRWSSSNKKIATVSSKGKVKFKKTGTVTIKCRTKKSSKKYVKCKFYVKKKASSFKISPGKSTLYVGESCSSYFSISPSNAYNVRSWSSSDYNVASVDANGYVTARNPGSATITATLKDGSNRRSSYTVTVINRIIQSEAGTKFIAHRGFSSQAPENTIKAFELAGDAGFWGAECDVQVTKDGKFVIFHDGNLNRMCGDGRSIENMTFGELQALNIKTGNNYDKYRYDEKATKIPTLDQYLDVCLQKNMVPVIEIKMAYNVLEEENMQAQSIEENVEDELSEEESSEDIILEEVELEETESEETDQEITELVETESEETESEETESGEIEQKETVSEEEIAALELEEEIQDLPEVHELHGQELQEVNRTTLERLYDRVKAKMGNRPYIFIAFDERCIEKMENLYVIDKTNYSAPNMSIQWLIGKGSYNTNVLNECIEKGRGLDMAYGALPSSYIRTVQRQGVPVNVWTVDDVSKTRELYNAGADYITTNVKNFE